MNNTRRPFSGKRAKPRGGALLFEVLVALFVLFVGLVSVGQYLSNAARSSARGRLTAEGIILCEAKLNELLATNSLLANSNSGLFSEDSQWSWAYHIEPVSPTGLQQLTVSVWHTTRDLGPVWSLARLLRPPTLGVTQPSSRSQIPWS